MNFIFCAYASAESYSTSPNLKTVHSGTSTISSSNVYLKNALVALSSAKFNNPTSDVGLIVNIDIGDEWINQFTAFGVSVIRVPYDNFVFSKDYPWSLAFFKLCALKYVSELDYENVVLLDTDTFIQRPFVDIWEETKEFILLSEINKGFYNADYFNYCKETMDFLGKTNIYLTKWGGEFMASNKSLLQKFMAECKNVYAAIQKAGFVTSMGDEFIIGIAAYNLRAYIKPASGYVFRYWTTVSWYYVCSNYRHNPVAVLHCPGEKEKGFLQLYNFISRKRRLPSPSTVYRKLHLNPFSFFMIMIIREIKGLLSLLKK